MEQLEAYRRPHYPPTERLAILELRAARGWSLAQTARMFLVSPLTIASWMGRLDEAGPDALVRLPEPVNKFPDFVGYVVRRLKILCPTLGKVKMAQILARAGLHLGPTTVRRMQWDARWPEPRKASHAVPRVSSHIRRSAARTPSLLRKSPYSRIRLPDPLHLNARTGQNAKHDFGGPL
jgi:helix-turn-helix protein